jgi:PAS domain S-box-containing protein
VWAVVSDASRRQALEALSVLDTGPDPDFDRLTKLAASLFGAPTALVTLVDIDRQWFKSRLGMEMTELPIQASFGAYAIAERNADYLLVPDACKDPRFAGNPLVTGPDHVRFYVGAPIIVRGQRLGTVSVFDTTPHTETPQDIIDQLVDLAAVAGTLFELKDEARVRARTAAALMQEEWRHALTLEAGKVGSWVWDMRSGEMTVNDILRRMFGVSPTGIVKAEDLHSRIHPDDATEAQAALYAAFEEGRDYFGQFRVIDTGRWLLGRGRVYQRDGAGKPLVVIGVYLDITEQHEAAERTRVLLRELNHRVKNTLAIIQSLARQTVRQSSNPQQFIDAFSGRLKSLSDSHGLLADRDWSGIGLGELVVAEVGGASLSSPEQLVIDGGELHLPPDHALGLGLILHELASNAVKYGALSTPNGIVTVSWTADGDRRVMLSWKEANGPKVREPKSYGFGTKLIQRSLDKVLDSRVDLRFPPEGVEAEISFPLPD